MKLEEYETTTPDFATEYAPRPDATQRVAAKQRANTPAPTAPLPAARQLLPPGSAMPLGILAVLIIVIMLAMTGAQLATPRALQITSQPTIQATAAPALAVSTVAPAPTSAPTATPVPTAPPIAAEPAPQTGRGLTLDTAAPTPDAPLPTAAPATATPVPYIVDKPTLEAAIPYPTISAEEAAIVSAQTRFTPPDGIPCGPRDGRRACLDHADHVVSVVAP